jgi:hypothetical protein
MLGAAADRQENALAGATNGTLVVSAFIAEKHLNGMLHPSQMVI